MNYIITLILKFLRVEKWIERFHQERDRQKIRASRKEYLDARIEELRNWGKSDV